MRIHEEKNNKFISVLCIIICIWIGVGALQVPITAEAAENISISKTSMTIQVGIQKTLKIKGTKEKVSWSSENEEIATVDADGVVRGMEAGTTKIFAKVGENTYTCTVKVQKRQIRVLLKTTGYGSIFHSAVTVTSTKKFTISNGTETKTYNAKQKVTIKSNSSLFGKGTKLTIAAKDSGKIQITSISRSQGKPSYHGKIEVNVVKGKGMTLINQLQLEQYLYSVVSSEMSSSFSKEALKAQAVTARSFAYSHLESAQYKAYNADLDDSTSFQVYNNLAETASTQTAVKETINQVLKSENEIINTYYYSTSSGQSATPEEVWGGSTEEKYYQRKIQSKDGKEKNLSTESAFKNFWADKNLVTFDSNSEWYRWQTTISKTNLQKQINSKLSAYSSNGSKSVLVKQSNGTYKGVKITNIGSLKKISICERAKSGIAKGILITGSKATVKVLNATYIRYMLAPVSSKLEKQNGSSVSKMSILPSSFFYVANEKDSEGNVCFTVYGAGYGHGVGMSQNGANQMAKEGYDYKDIMHHYFQNITLSHIAE
ncbi:MAG: SpoIID/LytB domain-containing protein [Lachnospiraceae bacterium]|nr:SpoIID/LytB domain-containing protein [Lachnospiraceae bacterium]